MKILVTGGAGSIGSEVVRRLHKAKNSLRILDTNEEGLWSMRAELPGVETILGDVQHSADLLTAAEGMDAIIHCAAYKHVDLCETNPQAAWRVNVQGTANVIEAARDKRLVFISTDKAIEPECVMGKSKQQAERMVLKANGNVARFGNVLGTRGSLIPMVKRCAKLGVPIPLTDPRMTRFMMTTAEAVDLILEALYDPDKGKTFIPENPCSVFIGEFLKACQKKFAPQCEIVRVGARPGERLHEAFKLDNGELVWSNDKRYLQSGKDIFNRLFRSLPKEVA